MLGIRLESLRLHFLNGRWGIIGIRYDSEDDDRETSEEKQRNPLADLLHFTPFLQQCSSQMRFSKLAR